MMREFVKKGNFARCEETNDCAYLTFDTMCSMFSSIDDSNL